MPGSVNPRRKTAATSLDPCIENELIAGLLAESKYINPKFFYDETGSRLFERITHLPEYYPTRTELGLLREYRDEIAAELGRGQVLIEPGAGNCSKVRLLLPALRPACYVPVDISRDFLLAAARQLQAEFAAVEVLPVIDDMGADLELPRALDGLQRNVFYPGSTIGNYRPRDALSFLQRLRSLIGERGGLLIGVDLQKDEAILHDAYNDSAGITARFNLNILSHLNRLLDADFDLANFRHLAFYNAGEARIEMHLESLIAQSVTAAGEEIRFAAGERVLTEYSYKYTLEGFAGLAAEAGLIARRCWVDSGGLFSLQYFAAAGETGCG